ncbi:dihydrofolate reductase family protein [Streptomyces lincolnensis]|uniref:dihydrofolate reductase family protein n=2 Tax=Streptomyces TaxID=1883 RepID=UPI001E55BD36|nr:MULTISPECIES: dihydrofolate reductase family protein [Streptomyces]MCD7445245.1 dihydrofolate reductase family protein [Streptomyces lincolnensis]WLW54832.1 dihydrofolate reductase family protein [Streptomyces coralus]
MRIVITAFISLDGVVQAPGGAKEDTDGGFAHGGWTHPYFDPDVVGGSWDAALAEADALLFGRRTWQAMAKAWPQQTEDPFADRMNSIKKYVVSRTLKDSELSWNNSVLIPGDEALAHLRKLRESGEGRDLVVTGSSELARTLMSEGLVDELRLMVMPVVLGGGKSIFPDDGVKSTFELVSTATSPTGTQVCVYRKATAAPAPGSGSDSGTD